MKEEKTEQGAQMAAEKENAQGVQNAAEGSGQNNDTAASDTARTEKNTSDTAQGSRTSEPGTGRAPQNPYGGYQGYWQNGQGQQGGSQNPYGQYGQGSSQANSYGQTSQGNGQSPYGQYTQSGAQNNPYGRQPQQGQNPYGNPYPYHYGQAQNGPQGAGGAQGANAHRAAGANGSKPHKKAALKTASMVTAAALLFGVVSGGTMFGVNRAAELMFRQESQASVENVPKETQISEQPPMANTQAAAGENNGAVMLSDVSGIVDNAMPSVVAITNTMLLQSSNWFGQTQTYEVPSSGSGIVVGENDSELLVVTNNHVIENANSLTVTFVDGSNVDAAVKGTDSETDLAVIAVPLDKISADTKAQITTATLGDSDALKMGQGVIAIGNALGHGQSVTVGYVSALNREIMVDGVEKTVIQTDAAINPGNSGGALLNAAGEVVGINEAKYASSKVEGVGYAIPVSDVKDIIDDLMTRTTKVAVAEEEQGYLGVRLRNVDSASSELFGMPQGAFVYQIIEGSAADQSDLREKDIITKINGDRVTSSGDVMEMLTYYKVGDTITVTVECLEDGTYAEREVSVTLGERPKEETKQ